MTMFSSQQDDKLGRMKKKGYVPRNWEKRTNMFQQGDQVGYHGAKWKSALGGKEGFIVSNVEGEPNGYVVTFPEMKNGDQDYILPSDVLGEYRPSKNEPKRDNKHDVKVEQRRGVRSKKGAPAPTEED